MKIPKILWLSIVSCCLAVSTSHAGEWAEAEIKNEISYLAKKLLDMSGKDTYTVESPAFMKPYLGVCSAISTAGVKITCVTPGSGAAKSGLKTGDVLSEINGISMVNDDEGKVKDAYYTAVKTMKTGEVMELTVFRGSETLTLKATIGTISHPAYTLTVSNK
ncbi:MAG: PDZ domain-containing protein [Pseudomonadota bacterium]